MQCNVSQPINTKSSSKPRRRARLRSLQAEFLPPASIAAHLSASDRRNPLMRHTLMHSIVSFAPAADICISTSRQLVCTSHAPSRMLFTALLRHSRKPRSAGKQPRTDRTQHRSARRRREEVARGGCARRRIRRWHKDMLVECHRLDIFISDRVIHFCASTPGLTSSAALYLATEAGGVSDCF